MSYTVVIIAIVAISSILVAVMISGFGMFTTFTDKKDDPSEIETFDD